MIRVEGHFGELLQGRLGPCGPIALVSLPCPALAVTAKHIPGRGLTIHGSGQRLLTPARAHSLLKRLGRRLSGRIILHAEMPAGGGAGASTAALVAIAKLAGATDPDDIARACLAAEGASDPLMYADAQRHLWASRAAKTVSILPKTLEFDVIGGFFGAPQKTRSEDRNFPDISDLVPRWPGTSLTEMAELATISARRTINLRGPHNDPTEDIATRLGALGWVIAHTGSARGMIFPKGSIPPNARKTLIDIGFQRVITFGAGG